MNILQTMQQQVALGHVDQARVGLTLTTTRSNSTTTQGFPRRSAEWTNGYTTWSVVHAIATQPLYHLIQFLIPSVTCPASLAQVSSEWLDRHIVVAALTHMIVPTMNSSLAVLGNFSQPFQQYILEEEYNLPESRWSEAQLLGALNTETIQLSSPSKSTVEERLYDWCGETCHYRNSGGPWRFTKDSIPFLTNLSDEQFRLYYSIFLWVTGVLTGLGSEIFVCLLYLRTWTADREMWWRYVQLIFPLLVTTGLAMAAQRDFLSLLFVVVGLWKFGFREVIMYLYVGFLDVKAPRLLRVADVLNGLGTIIHHSITVWFAAMQLGGVFVPDRYVIACTTVPLMQHWFVLLANANPNLYITIELILEVYFEWIAFSYMGHYYYAQGLAGAKAPATMVLAHWFYWRPPRLNSWLLLWKMKTTMRFPSVPTIHPSAICIHEAFKYLPVATRAISSFGRPPKWKFAAARL